MLSNGSSSPSERSSSTDGHCVLGCLPWIGRRPRIKRPITRSVANEVNQPSLLRVRALRQRLPNRAFTRSSVRYVVDLLLVDRSSPYVKLGMALPCDCGFHYTVPSTLTGLPRGQMHHRAILQPPRARYRNKVETWHPQQSLEHRLEKPWKQRKRNGDSKERGGSAGLPAHSRKHKLARVAQNGGDCACGWVRSAVLPTEEDVPVPGGSP
ncbi:hypothetical protein CPLU01_11566 [Colletotrichum plurivorum]|uniref:Uncharacterized protein n=1 Tax=Colletotrichum plurivorum TaxID=2175906 RepID=A0A8H6K2A1_9PEZI|nr:hypothetical protein CPLU01_11566 [Colletotrichum plurivorum]